MAFPAGLTLITVTGQFTGYAPGPARASFRSTRWLSGPADDALVPPFVVHADVDATDGTFSVQLPATDDPGYAPLDWSYDVTLTYGGAVVRGSLELPYDGGPVDLPDRLNIDQDASTGSSYLLSALRGAPNGVASLDGLGKIPAAQLPASAGGDPDWSEITNKPATFPPSDHDHAIADVTGLQAELDALEGGGGGGSQLVVRRLTVTSGNLALAVSVPWVAVAGGPQLVLPAAVGDYVAFEIVSGLGNFGVNFVDMAVLVGGNLVRFLSSGGATAASEGAPPFYGDQSFDRWGPTFEFVVTAGDLSGGNVTVVFATKGSGGGTLYASTDYPLRLRALNHGPADVA